MPNAISVRFDKMIPCTVGDAITGGSRMYRPQLQG